MTMASLPLDTTPCFTGVLTATCGTHLYRGVPAVGHGVHHRRAHSNVRNGVTGSVDFFEPCTQVLGGAGLEVSGIRDSCTRFHGWIDAHVLVIV